MLDTAEPVQRVRVWFGSEVICSHAAEAERAKRYAVLMRQRFAGLRVTVDDEPEDGGRSRVLPTEPLWPLTVK